MVLSAAKKIMNRGGVSIIIAGFLAIFCRQVLAEQPVLTLDDALRLALGENRQLAIGQAKEDEARAGISLARSAMMPALDISGTLGVTRGLYSKDINEVSGRAAIKQDLYKGGAIRAGVRKSEFDLSYARASLSRDKQEVLLKVKKSFFTLILAERYCRLNRLIALNARRHFDYISELYKNGQVSESELIRMRAILRNAEYLYLNAGTQKGAAAEVLGNLIYFKDSGKIAVSGELYYDFRDAAYDAAFLRAVESRPELKLYDAKEKSAQEAVKVAKASGRPSLSATWDYYSSNRQVSGAEKNNNDHNVAGLTVSWPIFDGGHAKAVVEEAIAALKASKAQREQTLKDIATELRQACLGLQDSLDALKAAEEEVKVYRDNLREARNKYRLGIVSSLDIQDAALKYETAYFKKERAVYSYMLAGIDFDKATGGV